jgi:uncharacterized protein (TIGR02646 family)
MIRLQKLEKPQVLVEHGQAWTAEFLAARAAGRVTDAIRYRYRHAEIKATIKQETAEKCAYCESKITHTYPGDVEHINPVSKVPDQFVRWENLTLACGECNRRKGDYYNPQDPLINPYHDDPSQHFVAAGALIFGKPNDHQGTFAELKLQLNRGALRERRYERLSSLSNLIHRYANEISPDLKDLLRDELKREMENNREYAFVTKTFITMICDA